MPFDPSRLDSFSLLPGVYVMKNKAGDVLYIGKAKNLRARLKQYFLSTAGDGRAMIPYLVPKVESIETILVHSEKEALLLENNLIKAHQPIYNALLKDDKTYIALKVTKNSWPMVQLVRYRGRPEADGLYFGPYTSAFAARDTLDLIHRLFPLRQCSDQEFARRTRPCILYDMKRCIAPCVNKCSKSEYLALVDKVVKFLRGQDKEIVKELYQEMNRAAEEMAFEKAAAILITIRHIEKTIENQRVHKAFGNDVDAWGIFRKGREVIVSLLFFREGKLMGVRHHDFTDIAEDDPELLESFLLQYYERQEELPHEILLPVPLEESEVIAEILANHKKRKAAIYAPQRGDKLALVEMARLNAEDTFNKEKDASVMREKTLLEMQERLHLNQYPHRIECFDNSSLNGTDPVSAMVAFTDGFKDKNGYRKYKVKTVTGQDDYATMMEVLERRYKRGKEENNLPDLLIVDGGKGHLNLAVKVLADLNIITMDVVGVAKEKASHTKGMTQEQVFILNQKDPIFLRSNSPILFLLQQIRDEAHRFALTFQRKRRSKQIIRTDLIEISGIGVVKSKRLLRHFGSLKHLLVATWEQLQQVKGLSLANIQAIQTFQKERLQKPQ